MRGFLVVLAVALALAPAAAAEPAETIRLCSEVGCVVAQDTDGDGEYDWTNVALVPGGLHAAGVFVNVNRTDLEWDAALGTEESGEVTGIEMAEFHVLFVGGVVTPEETTTFVDLEQGNEETGEWTPLAGAVLTVSDPDGDRVPDAAITITLP